VTRLDLDCIFNVITEEVFNVLPQINLYCLFYIALMLYLYYKKIAQFDFLSVSQARSTIRRAARYTIHNRSKCDTQSHNRALIVAHITENTNCCIKVDCHKASTINISELMTAICQYTPVSLMSAL